MGFEYQSDAFAHKLAWSAYLHHHCGGGGGGKELASKVYTWQYVWSPRLCQVNTVRRWTVPSAATRVRLVWWELRSFILAQRSMPFYRVMIEFSEPPATDGADKFTSTVHTVGRLSNKFARRVYNILSSQVKNLNKDNVQQYVNSLATIMHLTNYLSALNQNLKAATSRNETQNSEVGESSSNVQKTEEKKSTIA